MDLFEDGRERERDEGEGVFEGRLVVVDVEDWVCRSGGSSMCLFCWLCGGGTATDEAPSSGKRKLPSVVAIVEAVADDDACEGLWACNWTEGGTGPRR